MPNSIKLLTNGIKGSVNLSSMNDQIIEFLQSDSSQNDKWKVFLLVLAHPLLHQVNATALCKAWEALLNHASCKQVKAALDSLCMWDKGKGVMSYLGVLFDRGLYGFLEAFFRIKGDLAWNMLVRPDKKLFVWNRYVSRGKHWSHFEAGLSSVNTNLADKAMTISVLYRFFCSRQPHGERAWKSLMSIPVCFSEGHTGSLPLDYWCTLPYADEYPDITQQLHQGGLPFNAIFTALHFNNIATAKLLMSLWEHDEEIAGFLYSAMGANIAFQVKDLEVWLYPVLDALNDSELANACLSAWISPGMKESAKCMRNVLLQRYAPRMIAGNQVLSTKCGLHVLHAAVLTDMPLRDGFLPVFEKLKDQNVLARYINTTNSSGETPLFFAVQKGNLAVVKHLLDHGADPGWLSPHCSYSAPICEAFVSKSNVDSRMVDVICKLLVEKTDLPERFINGMVMRAVQLHDIDMLKRLSHYFSADLPNRLKQFNVTKEEKNLPDHALELILIVDDVPFKEQLLEWILRYVDITEPYSDFHHNILHDLVLNAKDIDLIKMLANKYPQALFRSNCYQITPLFLAMQNQDIDESTFTYLVDQAKQYDAELLKQLLDQRVIYKFSSGDVFTFSILHAGVDAMHHSRNKQQNERNNQQVGKMKKLISEGVKWYEPYPSDAPTWIKALTYKSIRTVYLAAADHDILQRVETRQLFYECFHNMCRGNEAYLMMLDMCHALRKQQMLVEDADEKKYLVEIVHEAKKRGLIKSDAFAHVMDTVFQADAKDLSVTAEQAPACVGVSGFRFVRDKVNAGLWDAVPVGQVKPQADMPSLFTSQPVMYHWSSLGCTSHSEHVVRVSGSCSTMPWFLYIDKHALFRQGIDSTVIEQFQKVRAKLDYTHIRALTLDTYMQVVMPYGDGTPQSVRIAYEIKLPKSEERIYCFTKQSDESGQDASVLIIGFYYGTALHNSAAVRALEQTTRVISLGQSDGQVAQSRP